MEKEGGYGIPGHLSCVSGGVLLFVAQTKNLFWELEPAETPKFWDAVHCPVEAHSCKTGTMNPMESYLQSIAPRTLLSKKSQTGPFLKGP